MSVKRLARPKSGNAGMAAEAAFRGPSAASGAIKRPFVARTHKGSAWEGTQRRPSLLDFKGTAVCPELLG